MPRTMIATLHPEAPNDKIKDQIIVKQPPALK